MYYIDSFKHELVDTNVYKLQPSLSEWGVVDGHGCHTTLYFGVKVKENQDKVPMLYRLPKLHKNLRSCTTTELSKLLTSCLTAVKNMLSSTMKRYIRDPVKIYLGLLKIQVKFWINLKLEISMRPVCLLTIFSTLYPTLPPNLITDKLLDFIERTSNREGSPYLACNVRNAVLLQKKTRKDHAWSCQNVCDALTFLLDNIFIRFGTKLYK